MIIGVDIGNTQLKWQVYGKPTIGVCRDVNELIAALEGLTIVRIVCCSVRGPNFDGRFKAALSDRLGIEPEFYRSEPGFAGVKCAYGEDYHRLGADRWLAILAAARLGKDCMAVVDIGTAITIDIVDVQQGHLGGYIVPGFATLIESINSSTQLIQIEPDYEAGILPLGSSTSECVNLGCVNMVVGFVDSVLDRYPGVFPLFCGGGYEMIKNHLRNKGLYKKTLVFDGLFERSVEHKLKR